MEGDAVRSRPRAMGDGRLPVADRGMSGTLTKRVTAWCCMRYHVSRRRNHNLLRKLGQKHRWQALAIPGLQGFFRAYT
jgi:hypothetical protein